MELNRFVLKSPSLCVFFSNVFINIISIVMRMSSTREQKSLLAVQVEQAQGIRYQKRNCKPSRYAKCSSRLHKIVTHICTFTFSVDVQNEQLCKFESLKWSICTQQYCTTCSHFRGHTQCGSLGLVRDPHTVPTTIGPLTQPTYPVKATCFLKYSHRKCSVTEKYRDRLQQTKTFAYSK